ncbi:acyltransferase [Bradyrhizobium sp. Rc2d]|uniref:acyltransferase n=1 Tax=Bradyrhizobium sp. Rc2d TaxID=1855321 RepID=UPI000B8158F9|nr:acyltransferase [Bradyrhizobium sp. Rc2d]
MNLDYWAQRILKRATCELDRGARLTGKARVRNIAGDSSLITIGRGSIIQGELLTFAHGGRIRLGQWCYVGEHSRIWSAAEIAIGDRVLIAHSVNIFDNLTHPIHAAARHSQFKMIAQTGHPRELNLGEKPVRIEDDVWVGAGSFVLRGVTIGRGAIVGAGAVVTSDVPAYCIAAGNPAAIVRELSADER